MDHRQTSQHQQQHQQQQQHQHNLSLNPKQESENAPSTPTSPRSRASKKFTPTFFKLPMPEYTHHFHRPSSPSGQPPLRNGQKIKNCCKNLGSFLFSQVGLATMVILYSVMGGILFKAIEGPSEKKVKEIMRFKWDDTAGEIMNLAIHLNIPTMNHTQFVDIIKNVLYRYQEVIVMAVKNEGFNGKFGSDESSIQWSFAGSLLYAVTVITTIGYGHVVPKTPVGRLVTILYALLGIPLTFLYLSNVGNFAAKCFRLFYKKFCCGVCIYVRLLRHKRRMLNVRRQAEAQMKSQEAFDSIVESTFISAKRGGVLSSRRATATGIPKRAWTPLGLEDETPSLVSRFRSSFKLPSISVLKLGKKDNGRKPKSDKSMGPRRVSTSENFRRYHRRKQSSDVDETEFIEVKQLPVIGTEVSDTSNTFNKSTLSDSSVSDHRNRLKIVINPPVIKLDECNDPDDSLKASSNKKQLDIFSSSAVSDSFESDSTMIEMKNLLTNNRKRNHDQPRNNFQDNFNKITKIESLKETNTEPNTKLPTVLNVIKNRISNFTDTNYTKIRKKLKLETKDLKDVERSADQKLKQKHSFSSVPVSKAPTTSYCDQSVEVSDDNFFEIEQILNKPNFLASSTPASTPKIPPSKSIKLKNIRYSHQNRPKTQRIVLTDYQEIVPTSSKAETPSDNTSIHTHTSIHAQHNINLHRGHSSPFRKQNFPSTSSQNQFEDPPSPTSATTTRMAASAACTAAAIATMASRFVAPKILKSPSSSKFFISDEAAVTTPSNMPSSQTSATLSPADTSQMTSMETSMESTSSCAPIISKHSTKPATDRKLVLHLNPFQNKRQTSIKWKDTCRSKDENVTAPTDTAVIPASKPTTTRQHRKFTYRSKSLDDLYGYGQHLHQLSKRSSSFKRRITPIIGTVSNPFTDVPAQHRLLKKRDSNKELMPPTIEYENLKNEHVLNKRSASFRSRSFRRKSTLNQPSNISKRDLTLPVDLKPQNILQKPDGDASEDDLEYVKMTVPISICLIIITLYIYLGAQLFSYWEKWDLITSSYFCFITLSTIGFGDLVPGIDSSQDKAHQKLMLCSLWLVVGLSLLAMCFNLMQEEVKENFRWIGMKLGVLKQ